MGETGQSGRAEEISGIISDITDRKFLKYTVSRGSLLTVYFKRAERNFLLFLSARVQIGLHSDRDRFLHTSQTGSGSFLLNHDPFHRAVHTHILYAAQAGSFSSAS